MSIKIRNDLDAVFIDIGKNRISISLEDDAVVIHDHTDSQGDLTKPELAQLIAALQTMHDKMIDNNISK